MTGQEQLRLIQAAIAHDGVAVIPCQQPRAERKRLRELARRHGKRWTFRAGRGRVYVEAVQRTGGVTHE